MGISFRLFNSNQLLFECPMLLTFNFANALLLLCDSILPQRLALLYESSRFLRKVLTRLGYLCILLC